MRRKYILSQRNFVAKFQQPKNDGKGKLESNPRPFAISPNAIARSPHSGAKTYYL